MQRAKKIDPKSTQQVLPTISRRLGGGLASVVKRKMVEKKEIETEK